MNPNLPFCSAIIGVYFSFLPRRNVQEERCRCVEPKLNYSLLVSEAEKLHIYFSDIYSALNVFKKLILNKMV